MIAELTKILPKFSEVSHTRCFLHIVNLVAKSIIKQFNVPKKREDEHLDEAEQELRNLVGDVEQEEQEAVEAMTQHQIGGNMDSETEDENDDVDGWVDEMMLLSPAERERVEEDIRPVKLVLVTVRYEQYIGKRLT
jgi:hypothetical protein